jgi:hypothetical protein
MKASKIIKPKESLQEQQIKTPVPSASHVLVMFNRQKGFVNLMERKGNRNYFCIQFYYISLFININLTERNRTYHLFRNQ